MSIRKIARRLRLATILLAVPFPSAAEDLTNALRAFVQQRVESQGRDVAMVIGIVDEHGSRVVGCGKLDNGTSREVNGDTLFEIGSITKTFTALLLQDMVERGEMKLDDPVANYLPHSVKMPIRHGREITLAHLATHTSGLPLLPGNLDPKRADNPYADYTVEKMYAFLSGCTLDHDPGAKYEYSELGMELLGHAIERKAGTNYESLLADRICGPLKMDSTRVTLTPEMKSRTAIGHDQLGHPIPGLDFQSLVGGSGLRSTANDLLKYLSANLGLTRSALTPVMQKTHAIHFRSMIPGQRVGLGWHTAFYPQGREFMVHGGGTPGRTTFIAFDKQRRKGLVVLASSDDLLDVCCVGLYLLAGEWEPDRRPDGAGVESQNPEAYVGEYWISRNFALGILALRMLWLVAPKMAIGLSTGAGVAVAFVLCRYVAFFRKRWDRRVLRWRAAGLRKRRIILGCVVVLGGCLAVTPPLVAARVVWLWAHPVVNVRREGNRLFAEATNSSRAASKVILPQISCELLRVSDDLFFERMSGIPLTFVRDARGRAIRLTAPLFGNELSFVKVSDQPTEPPKRRTVVKLDPKLCDSFTGDYEFAPDDAFPNGIELAIRRQGDGLSGQASGTNGTWGRFDIYPESETNYFFTLTIVGVELRFVRNQQGEVTSVVRHVEGLTDRIGQKLNKPIE